MPNFHGLFSNFSLTNPIGSDRYFDINSAESIAYTADGKYAFVLFHNTYNYAYDPSRDPLFGHGSNIGILKDPFGPLPDWVGATEELPFGFGFQLTIDPTGQYLIATESGDNAVYMFDINRMLTTVGILKHLLRTSLRTSIFTTVLLSSPRLRRQSFIRWSII